MAKKEKDKVLRRKKPSKEKKPRKQRNQREPWTWKKWLFVFACFIFITIVVYVFIFSTLIQINDVQVNGVDNEKQKEITQNIYNSLKGEVVNGIMKSNYFFVNKDDITNIILEDKRIKEVVIIKKFPQTIIADIVEYDVLAVWCFGNINGKCFIIEDGLIKEPVTLDSDILAQNKYFIIVDEGQDNLEKGEMVILPEYLEKINFLGEELKYALSVGIEQPYFVLSKGSHEVRFVTDESWYILIDISQDVDNILDTVKLFFRKVELPSRRIDLEYIDLRFEDKIFYKMKENVEQEMKEDIDENSVDNVPTDKQKIDKDDKG